MTTTDYRISLSASSIRETTMTHAQALYDNEALAILPDCGEKTGTIIAEMDGCMVLVVQANKKSDDKRKGKTWCGKN